MACKTTLFGLMFVMVSASCAGAPSDADVDADDAAFTKGGFALQSALRGRAHAECERIFTCARHNMATMQGWADPLACETGLVSSWLTAAHKAGSRIDVAKQVTCTPRIASLSCAQYIALGAGLDGATGADECTVVEANGRLGVGAACELDAQCESGVCRRDYNVDVGADACGTCQPGRAQGEACDGQPINADATITDDCAGVLFCTPCRFMNDDARAQAPGCAANRAASACVRPEFRYATIPVDGNLPVGAACDASQQCAQPARAGRVECSPVTHQCTELAASVGVACDLVHRIVDGVYEGSSDSGCDFEQAGTVCSQACNWEAYVTARDGELVFHDEAGFRACLAAHPATCQDLGLHRGKLNEACGAVAGPLGELGVLCEDPLYCDFADANAEQGTCKPRLAVGAACLRDHWLLSPVCEAGATCSETTGVCEAEAICR